MCNHIGLYLLASLLCQIVSFTAAGGVNAGYSNVTASDLAPPTVSNQEYSVAKSDSVRFAVERATTPEPGVRGNIVDAEHAWVVGMDSGYLLRTIDGGKTWLAMHPVPSDEPRFGNMQGMYVKTFFASQRRGWLAANSGTWQTDDGGLTWRRMFAEGFDDMRFAGQRYGWTSVSINNLRHQQSYVTDDGGENWTACGTPRPYKNPVPMHTYFLSQTIAWSITSNPDEEDTRINIKGVAQSTDGGCSWKQLWESPDTDAKFHDVYFLNKREGWLSGEGSLLHTVDGGTNWSEIPRPQAHANVLQVHFSNSEEGWIIAGYPSMAADNTGVFRTTDAGKNWRQLSEREVINGFQEGVRLIQIPEQWQAGKLCQLLYGNRVARRIND